MYRIGIDVGGTNTDAAVLDVRAASTLSRGLLASCKTPTTPDVTSGIKNVVEEVLKKSEIDKKHLLSVAIGTTHFVNAVVQNDAQRLSRVAVVRLCGPYTREIPPFADFPSSLKDIMAGPVFYLDGGLEIDGREISSLDPAQVKETTASISKAGIKVVAIVGVFSALDHSGIHEERCKALMLEHEPELSVVCSHSIGGPGLLARENATILNSSILSLAKKTIHGYRLAMSKLGLQCPLYLTQNDGTLTNATAAAELPIKTFASGPTNSMTGAAFLQGLDIGGEVTEKQILVVDVGGTTTDVCALLPSGFPRQAPNFVDIGGVRTAFSMPEVLSIGLGGGSQVKINNLDGAVSVGPDSVGHHLTTEALVFGGQTLTSTDIAVACGAARIGDPGRVKHIPLSKISEARRMIKQLLERAIEDMKVSAAPVTVLLVGGGSVIHMDDLEGVADCISPPHHDSANAVGAAIAKVAGETDVIELLEGQNESEILEAAKQNAIAAAVAKGADIADVKIVELEKIPLQYVTNKATRILVKAVGRLQQTGERLPINPQMNGFEELKGNDEEQKERANADGKKSGIPQNPGKPALNVDIAKYRPYVRNGVWYLSPVDVELIACGTGVLGTGGGGPSYNAALYAIDILKKGGAGRMRIIAPKTLADTDLCVFGAGYGAPSVSGERIASGTEIFAAIDALNHVLGYDDFQAIVADEIGGGNGLATFPTSARYDRPIVDADMMGRAYPSMEHGTPYVYGQSITPCGMADAKGNIALIMGAESNKRVEGMLRTTCMELGNSAAVVAAPLKGAAIKQYAVPNTVSQSWYIGRAVHLARRTKADLIESISEVTPVRLLYTGKIVDVNRDVSRGYTVGRCLIAPMQADEVDSHSSRGVEATRYLVIPFQNEFLYAALVDSSLPDSKEDVICTVPDLISILGQDGEAIGSQELRYGLRVRVIAMPAHPLWTGTEEGLKLGGPEYFHMKMKWKSVGEYQTPRSVIEEFDVTGSQN